MFFITKSHAQQKDHTPPILTFAVYTHVDYLLIVFHIPFQTQL